MMFKISKPKSRDVTIVEKSSKETEEPHKHPIICLLDFEKNVKENLEKLRFNYVVASFGSTVKVNNK